MDCDETDLKEIHDTEQMAIIDKLRSMRWLKNTIQLSDHGRRSNGREINSITNRSKINERAGGSTEVLSTAPSCESPDRSLTVNVGESKCTSDNNTQSAINVIESSEQNMEAVWNKDVNVASTLFPNSQSLVLERLDEEEMMSMALAESIVTAQLEQLRLDSDKMSVPEAQCDDSDDDTWGAVRRNLPDSPKSENNIDEQVSSQHPHDNNNNNAKSKAQSVPEPKKSTQKTVSKAGFKKLDEQKVKRQTDKGTTLKDSNIIARRCTKDKDDSQTLNNDNNNASSTNTDIKKSSSSTVPKFVDKFNRVDGYNNRHTFIGKGARAKEQDVLKQHFSTSDNDCNKGRSATEETEDKARSVCARLKSPKTEIEKKPSDISVPRKCHNVQITRTSSYNVQYNRTKALNKLPQRYQRGTVRSEQENANKKLTPVSTTPSATVENNSRQVAPKVSSPRVGAYKKPDRANEAKNGGNENASSDKQIVEVPNSEGASSKMPPKSSVAAGSAENVEHATRPPSSASHKICAPPSFSSAKTKIESKSKQDSALVQRPKKDPSVFRRSTECLDNKHPSAATKSDDHKRCTIDANASKTYKINRLNPADTKASAQSEATKGPVNATKVVEDNNIYKTDTPNPISSNAGDPAKPADCRTSNTNDSTSTGASIHKEAPPASQGSTNEVKTTVPSAQAGNSNTPSNNKFNGSNTEAKSVKFSDNVQQIAAADYSASYTSNPPQQSKASTNPFISNLQNAPNARNGQQVENQHSKNYFETNGQYADVSVINVHNSNQYLHMLDSLQQNGGQMLHSPQSIVPQSIPSSSAAAAASGMLNYQHPAMYVNQYNNMHAVPRKTSDTANISQNAPIPSSTTYSPENSSLLQNELSNVMMHGNQTAVMPPPGFHGNPLVAQQSQWNMPIPEMLYFGNMMGGAHPLNVQLQNSRSVCGNDFNSMQQANYLQHPLFYMPPLCMQGWNPLVPYPPAPLLQNHQYPNCNTFPNQVMPTSSLTDPISCPVSTSTSNNSYKHYHQIQHLENNPPNFTAPILELENYAGGMQGCANKSSNMRMKDSAMDAQMRAGQYHRTSVPNDYQNCSQDGQVMTPFSYPATHDSFSRNGQSNNIYTYVQHKYHGQRGATSNYQKMPEGYPVFHSSQESIGRKDYNASKNDSECVPPMVSPRECMYYGVNYSRATDNIGNPVPRSDMKTAYVHAGTSSQQHCVPQYQKNATYHFPAKDLASRVPIGRGTRKTMEP